MRQFLLICLDHSNSIEIDVTLQPQLSMEGTTARLHPSGSNCCAFSTSISHTSTFVEEGPRPYIWMLKEIGKLVIPTSFQWGLPQSSNLANLSALMIMMGLLQGEVWSRHKRVSSLGWRICEVKNVTKRYNDPGSSSQVYLGPQLCILHYKIVPQNMVYHFFWPLDALSQWNLHCSWAVLNWRCSMFPSPFKTLFQSHTKQFGLHTMVFLSSWEPEWRAGRNWHVRQFSVWTFKTLPTSFQNSRDTRVHNCFLGLNPWIRHYMRFLATKPLFSLKMVVYIRASPQKT